MKEYNFFAFDLGATSGRSILGTLSGGRLTLKELTRFPNKIIRIQNRYYWNIYFLFDYLKEGLQEASSLNVEIDAIGIDTWGVDFVYLAEDGTILNLPRSYRDPYTKGAANEYFRMLPQEEVYSLTGIQVMDFNSLFQLYAAKKENSSALSHAGQVLFMPDALSYLLTGKAVCEYTIASTSQLLNSYTKKIEAGLLAALDVNSSIFPDVIMPGQKTGNITEEISKECGLRQVPVIAVAGHDTASAVVAVPAEDEQFAYLSSGTWSLMGIEVQEPIISDKSCRLNFTNEGGIDNTIRFLKNITGMWLLEQCRKQWSASGEQLEYSRIVSLSESVEGFRYLIDPDHPSFANPDNMLEAIAAFCRNTGQGEPESKAAFIRCIFDSLALKYKHVLNSLHELAPFPIKRLHVIGGGSQNRLLNRMTADAIGLPVIAGPCEATAIGNIMMQAKGLGLVGSLNEIRRIVRDSFEPEIFHPQDTHLWDEAYAAFRKIAEYTV
jgi:rhamnulokinase